MMLEPKTAEAIPLRDSDRAANDVQATDYVSLEGRLHCQLIDGDRLALIVDGWRLQSQRLKHASLEQLRQAANEFAARLNYLLEPLATIEIDEGAKVVQMRSLPPHREPSSVSYFEVELRPGELRLCRYAKVAGQARERIPTTVTREVFARIENDLKSFA